jgi:hypothetical protein
MGSVPETVSYELLIGIISFHLHTSCQDQSYCRQLLTQLQTLNSELKEQLRRQHQRPHEPQQ